MLCILSTNRDIYFNLATEEYFLRFSNEEVCMLWQSDDSVVVGKHQNAMAEVNYLWTVKQGIPIARRLTGGGTVYHGPGNLNFSFIRNGEPGKLVDFNRFVTPVIGFLLSKGILAEAGTRNDILVNNLKISGNAEHVYKTRVLHHGTLLFAADLKKLNESIRVTKDKYRDKAVPSVRSQVTNIKSLLNSVMTLTQFEEELFAWLQSYYDHTERYDLVPREIDEINLLCNEKYRTTNWIFGYSPPFDFSTTSQWKGFDVNITMAIYRGLIQQIQLVSAANGRLWRRMEEHLTGCPYRLPALQKRIHQIVSDEDEATRLAEMLF
jgi:lipoate-protein ligase A